VGVEKEKQSYKVIVKGFVCKLEQRFGVGPTLCSKTEMPTWCKKAIKED